MTEDKKLTSPEGYEWDSKDDLTVKCKRCNRILFIEEVKEHEKLHTPVSFNEVEQKTEQHHDSFKNIIRKLR